LRKLCRRGLTSFPDLCKVYLRGDALYTAADATTRAAFFPYRMRKVWSNSGQAPVKDVTAFSIKHGLVDLAHVTTRYVATALGATCSAICHHMRMACWLDKGLRAETLLRPMWTVQ
jgi:hypothetical protein